MDISRTEGKRPHSSLFYKHSPHSNQAQLSFLWEQTRNKKVVLKIMCIQFPSSRMLIPNLRAPIAMKIIYPANSHVEQQIDFLPKWIECIQSNHHPAKGVQINLAWLLCLLFISPQFPVPKSTHSTLILFFFLTKCWHLPWGWWGGFHVSFPMEAAKLVSGNPMNYPFSGCSGIYMPHLPWHVWQKLWEGS